MTAGSNQASQLPAIRGQTAPAGATRGISRGSKGIRAKGLDGKPLKTQPAQGMTLADYALGGAWGTGVSWASNGAKGGKENLSSAGNPRVATAPCWRKPKA